MAFVDESRAHLSCLHVVVQLRRRVRVPKPREILASCRQTDNQITSRKIRADLRFEFNLRFLDVVCG